MRYFCLSRQAKILKGSVDFHVKQIEGIIWYFAYPNRLVEQITTN